MLHVGKEKQPQSLPGECGVAHCPVDISIDPPGTQGTQCRLLMLVGGGRLDVKREQDPPHRCSPVVTRHWQWARLARQSSRRRRAQHRDQNSARCGAPGLTHAAWREKIPLSDRGRLLRWGALSRKGENHSAQDSSFKETLTVHVKPPEAPGSHVLQGMPPASTLSHPDSDCGHSRVDSWLTKSR